MNNAGIGSAGSSTWSGRDVWTKILDVNLWGVCHMRAPLFGVIYEFRAGHQYVASIYKLDDQPGMHVFGLGRSFSQTRASRKIHP